VSRHGPLLWADEFDGPAGAPADPRTWQPETGGHGWGNAELQYYTGEPGNAALDGAGHLAITVRRAAPELAAARYDGCRYTSARLITKDLKPVRYGLIEASIKIPGGRGIWPAFWLLGTDIGRRPARRRLPRLRGPLGAGPDPLVRRRRHRLGSAGQIDVVSADHAGGLRPRLRSIGVLAD
jgi:beta-glucanase (GH16 family)